MRRKRIYDQRGGADYEHACIENDQIRVEERQTATAGRRIARAWPDSRVERRTRM
jgi:hypothetical protein